MHSLAASRAVTIELAPWGHDLTAEELDTVRGGVIDPIGIAVLVFTGGVVVGILDRILFGGCKCR